MTQGWAFLPVHLTYITRVHQSVYIFNFEPPHQRNYSYTTQLTINNIYPVIPSSGFYVINTRQHIYVATRTQLLVRKYNNPLSSHLHGQIHQSTRELSQRFVDPTYPVSHPSL